MDIPGWADANATALLLQIRAGGEKQLYEFKEDFGDGRKLGKSVAAMATSGGGLILLGVRDNGTVAGLDESQVDRLVVRAHSICEEVKPWVAHRIMPCYDEGLILVVSVDLKQSRPVYYYDGKPYIRVGPRSRPATPEEVEAKILAHPSAEHKKRMEDLNYEQAKNAAELSAKRTAAFDTLAIKSAEDHHGLMSKSRESIQKTNEMVRQAFIPK